MSLLTVIAGPNGSGKSSFTARLEFEGKDNVLDPDAVAKRMNPADTASAAIAAAREVITRTREYLERRASFAIETTLSGRNYLDLMEEARSRGYHVRLIYVAVNRPIFSSRPLKPLELLRFLPNGIFSGAAD